MTDDPFACLNETERLLLEFLDRDPAVPKPAATALLGFSDWERLAVLAKVMRISPLLYRRLQEKGPSHHLPDACRSTLRDACRDTTLRNLRAYGALRRLARLLEREDIPIIVLKGIFLADAVYRDIGLREMNDIDLLARPQHVQRIAELAGELGYTPRVDVSQEDAEEIHLHLPRLIKDGEAGLEIHWNVTPSNKHYRIDPDELWKRAVPVKLQGTDVLAFCPEDMLLHLCLHTSYHHQFAFGLRPSCDIAELLLWCGDRFDWDAVLERAERWGWGRGVYMALLLAKKLAGAPVPGRVTARLQPSDFTADILSAAVLQVLTNSSVASKMPKPFADLILYERLGGKLGILLNRVFLPKRTMAVLYPACRGSWKIYVYYPRRLLDVLRRHGRTFRKIKQGDPELLHLAKRKQLIDGFLQKI